MTTIVVTSDVWVGVTSLNPGFSLVGNPGALPHPKEDNAKCPAATKVWATGTASPDTIRSIHAGTRHLRDDQDALVLACAYPITRSDSLPPRGISSPTRQPGIAVRNVGGSTAAPSAVLSLNTKPKPGCEPALLDGHEDRSVTSPLAAR
jgi:hypothetical protein